MTDPNVPSGTSHTTTSASPDINPDTAKDTRPAVQVIAVQTGYDGDTLREPGTTFWVPASVFDKRPRVDANGEPIRGQFYEPPAWFEPVDRSHKAKIEAERRETRRALRIHVPAIDPARQQAEAQAEGRLMAMAQEAVRQELKARDDAEIEKRVQAKLAEIKGAQAVPPKPDPKKPEPKKPDEKP